MEKKQISFALVIKLYSLREKTPGRLCAHVVIVVGLVWVNDPLGYAVEPLMPDRSKVRFQIKRDTGVYAERRR